MYNEIIRLKWPHSTKNAKSGRCEHDNQHATHAAVITSENLIRILLKEHDLLIDEKSLGPPDPSRPWRSINKTDQD